MRNIRQVILGFLAALLSAAVILGSLSLSFSESGLKLAMQSTPTRTRGPRLSTITPTAKAATQLLRENSTLPLFTPSVTVTFTPMYPFTTQPPPPASCPPPVGWSSILIQTGDTLESLAQFYNATIEALIQANCLVTQELIAGTLLYVPGAPPTEPPIHCGPPPGWVFYKVQPGDTLFHIGITLGVTVAELQFANCLGSSTLIRVGQRIFVPNVPTRTPTTTPTRPVPTTPSPSATATQAPTFTPTVQSTPTPGPIRTNTPVPPSQTPIPSPTGSPTPTLPTPTPTGTNTPTQTTTPSPNVTPSVTPTVTPTASPTDTPVPASTETPTPTLEPTSTETITPTTTPTNTPLDTTVTPTPTATQT